ncbi:MAG: type II secretion system protein GspJ [Alphaproteobacteria bacterium RIFCSPHIGHO2_12_FULL_63_12]|nr:MAG: type II secretion system protein GspJ [Alphaproteobacteria bacterium RIFCSPHIGHO2_12_FULL_63_12]
MSRQAQRGLTLPELLIALLIFAMISGAAVYALRLSVEGREQLEIADGEIREFQIMRQVMKQDFSGIVARTVRDDFGNSLPAPFLGGEGLSYRLPVEGEKSLMVFVRSGWTNPDDRAPRPTLQAVEYLIKGGDLVRRVRPYLDDARGQPRTDRVLIAGVSEVEIGFFTGAEDSSGPVFSDLWPMPQSKGSPEAIRLTMTTKRFGEIEQLFWLGER